MKRLLYAVMMVVAVLTAAGTVTAQPRPLPASPEETRLAEQYPALRDERAAATGGFVIAGVNDFGCASSSMLLDLAMVIPNESQEYVMRTRVTQNNFDYQNERSVMTFASGMRTWIIGSFDSGGSVGHAFPLTAGTPVLVRMLLSLPNGKPLWYSEMQIDDCDGSPGTISFTRSSPTRVIASNPTFKPDSSALHATKWTSSGKVSYSCADNVCTFKLTGKSGKTAKIEQTVKLSPPIPANGRLGLTTNSDTAGVTGAVRLYLNPTSNGAPLFGSAYFNLVDGNPLFASTETIHLPAFVLSLEVDKITLKFEFLDDDALPAAGKVKLRALYFYAVDF